MSFSNKVVLSLLKILVTAVQLVLDQKDKLKYETESVKDSSDVHEVLTILFRHIEVAYNESGVIH